MAVLETWVERVWNERDLSAIRELFSDTGIAHGNGQDEVGPAGLEALFHALHGACRSLECTLGHRIVADDQAAVLMKFVIDHVRGSHPITFEMMAMVKVADGRIVEAWNMVDWLTPLIALGIAPPDAMAQVFMPGELA